MGEAVFDCSFDFIDSSILLPIQPSGKNPDAAFLGVRANSADSRQGLVKRAHKLWDTMIDGTTIFRLHDTQGLPFDYILDELRENRCQFDVISWMNQAIFHGWTYDKIMTVLCTPLGYECNLRFKLVLTRIYLSLTEPIS